MESITLRKELKRAFPQFISKLGRPSLSSYSVAMSSSDGVPSLLYQSVLLEPNIYDSEVKASTTLWLGYRVPVKSGDRVFLHCRQSLIEEVYINGVKADFLLNDGLRSLAPNKKQTYLSEELDLNYRAALEIARLGELQLTIPDLSDSQAHTELPIPLPRPSPKDCMARYDKLVRVYKTLTRLRPTAPAPAASTVPGDCSPLGMDDPTHPTVPLHHLLQIRIVYSVSAAANSSSSGSGASPLAGLVFRQPSLLGKLFAKKQKARFGASASGKSDMGDAAVCAYSTSFTSGTLRDVDGVRCWLPTVDALDQRAVFDVSIVAPRHWRVVSCGKKLSTFLLASNEENGVEHTRNPLNERKITRFFTPNRIPAMSVGWYMGAVEMYKMPLYKLRSRLWVSLGLADYTLSGRGSGDGSEGEERESGNDTDGEDSSEEKEEENKVFLRPLDASYYAAFKRTLRPEAVELAAAQAAQAAAAVKEAAQVAAPPRKRAKVERGGATNSGGTSVPAVEPVAAPDASEAGGGESGPGAGVGPSDGAPATQRRRRPRRSPYSAAAMALPGLRRTKLYERAIQHTTLGMDISLRLLHKFVGHRHDYDEVVMIFVPELGADYVAYDGFCLIDAKFLHTEADVTQETPTHMVLLEAYLYSWLQSSLPVAAYDCEFILHGTVGYLLNFYAEEVFGEDDGRYRYQRMYDTVIALEKQGQGFPLASFFSEQYDHFGVVYGAYLRCKSAVLFQLIENRVGGKEHMRITLKQLIRSPPVYNPVLRTYKGANTEIVSNFQGLFAGPQGRGGGAGSAGSRSPMYPNMTPPTPSMVNKALHYNEELRRHRSYSEDGSVGGHMSPFSAHSPYSIGNRSPSIYSGNLSPLSHTSGNLSPYAYGGMAGNISPYSGGNISPNPYGPGGNVSPNPYSMGGNMSPYAQYAGFHPTLGAATPAYDAYAHTTRYGGGAAGGAVPQIQTYSPSRYEVSASPAIAAGAAEGAADGGVQLDKPLPTTHLETAEDADLPVPASSAVVRQDTADAAVTAPVEVAAAGASEGPVGVAVAAVVPAAVPSSSVTVPVPVVDATAPGFYASITQRRERADSLSLANAGAPVVTTQQLTGGIPAPDAGANKTAPATGGPAPASAGKAKATSSSAPALQRQGSLGSATGDISGHNDWWSFLHFDCVSAESFILLVRHASGASADISEDFLDRYVYKSGILFLRMHVSVSEKVDTKPRQISIAAQQVGHREHDAQGKAIFVRDLLKVRIAEVRDEVVTEPFVPFANKEEEFQQQAYTRAGRRGGKRRGPSKKTEEVELTPQQREEQARRNREREERKSALMKARDLDYPLRYVVVDPQCQHIIDAYNASTDIVLVEQLYTDFLEHSVYFQCQALRSLARAGTSSGTILCDITPEAAAFVTGASAEGALSASFNFGGGSGASSAVRIPEKSPRLQLRALSDCLMGNATQVADAKLVNGAQFSTFVRGEAALALARWQNERAPRNANAETTTSTSAAWPALEMLCDHMYSLFADPDTSVPLPADPTNESGTHLRNAMILAIASVRSKSGHTPPLAVETLLHFAQAAESGGGHDGGVGVVGNGNQYDDAHFRGVGFYALSQLRFESIPPVRGTQRHPIDVVTALALSAVSGAFTRARAAARIRASKSGLNALPVLAGEGVDFACAITCLSEMDIQAVTLYARGRAVVHSHSAALGSGGPTTVGEIIATLKDVDRNQPTGKGPYTNFPYVRYFLPADARQMCLADNHIAPTASAQAKEQVRYLICSPAVRLAAFEAFVRLCVALQGAHEERQRVTHGNSEAAAQAGLNTTFLPAVVEALSLILRYDRNNWVRQQAAAVVCDVMMDRPPRIAAQALSLHSFWHCITWSDPWGLTLPNSSGGSGGTLTLSGGSWSAAGVRSGRECMVQGGERTYTSIAMKLLWKLILSSMSYDQAIRQSLLTMWKYCFPAGKVPAVLMSSSNSDGRVMDKIFGAVLPIDRLLVQNPNDSALRIEQQQKHGTNKMPPRRGSIDGNLATIDHATATGPALTAAATLSAGPAGAPVRAGLGSGSGSGSSSSYAALPTSAHEPPTMPGLQRQPSEGGGLRLSLSLSRGKSTALGVEGEPPAAGALGSPIAAKAAPVGENKPVFKFVM